MNRTQLITFLVSLALAGVIGLMIFVKRGGDHQRYFLSAHAMQIGKDLISTTNSHHLVAVLPGLANKLEAFLDERAVVEKVCLGDEPSPIGNGKASSRLFLKNGNSELIGIRLKYDSEIQKFRVLGFWTVTTASDHADR